MEKKFKVWLYPGSGYHLDSFEVEGFYFEDALDNLVTKFVNKGIGKGDYWLPLDELNKLSDREIEEMGFMYVDSTRNGAKYPVYLRTENMQVQELK